MFVPRCTSTGRLPATLLTIADFGSVKNLKTDESEAILQALRRNDSEALLLCREKKNYKYKHSQQVVPLGSLFPKATDLICRTFGLKSRPAVKALLDLFAATKLRKACVLVTVPKGYPRTLKKNKLLGGINICYEATVASNYQWQDQTYRNAKDSILDLYDHFFLISNLAVETYLKQGIELNRLHLIHMGVDENIFHPRKKQNNKPFSVLCIGNDAHLKGFDCAVQAWNELDLPNAELRIVGVNAEKTLKEHARPGIVLKGFSNAAQEMQSADLLLHPAKFDAFGKIVSEAMACGLPVVVSEQTGAKDLVIENYNGSVIPTNDPEAIKTALSWHYNNRLASSKMGENARTHVLNGYTWAHFEERVHQSLNDINRETLETN